MNKNMFSKNDLVEFKDKSHVGKYSHDSVYVVLSVHARMKEMHGNRDWYDAVLYFKKNNPDEVFVREYNDFVKKFKKINNEEK